MPKAKMERIPFLPGRWIDFSDREHICIREADGTLVASDLYIEQKDFDKIVRKYKGMVREMTAKRDEDK
jgi:hypothetical protein